MKGIIDYKINCTTPYDYELEITYPVGARMLNYIFNASKKKLQKKLGKEIQGSPNEIDKFDIPKEYLRLLRTAISSHVNKLILLFKKDKIIILSDLVTSAKFTRTNEKKWIVKIFLTGNYVDKR